MLKPIRQTILFLGDALLAVASLLITLWLRYWGDISQELFLNHLLAFGFIYAIWFVIFYIFGLYELTLIKPKLELLSRMGQSFLFCLGLGIFLFYFVPFFVITPKINLLINAVTLLLLMALWRRLFYTLFSAFYRQNLAFLGKNHLAERLIRALENDPQVGYHFSGFLNKESLAKQLKAKKIDVLIIVENLAQNRQLAQELYQSLELKIRFWDLVRAYEIILQKVPIDFVAQTWFLENLKESEKKNYDNLKRIGDLAAAAILLTITLPLWVVLACLIKLEDRGPIFYRQRRVGQNRRMFYLWKFRSMRTDAEKQGPRWAQKNDPRVTKMGYFIRRWHLDELPQMLNVLKGDIALVGPRPERPEFVQELEKEIPHYHLRHLIKAGFTGWAQIKFRYARSVQDSHEKFQYDLYYIKNRSFFLDLGILLKTFQLFFKRED
jgi:exopolysaccharide biosynthesis polyprenyl glycosylphosphotransferase